jgi:acyl-CoA synthetase (AMP-forming)/AMP-acid ligase II
MDFFDKNYDYKNHTLFVNPQGHRITYDDWYYHSNALRHITQPRSLAAIICRNTIGSALSYLCCLQNRIVPILIDGKMDDSLKQHLLELYKPNYIFSSYKNDNKSNILYNMEGYAIYRYFNQQHTLHPDLALLLTTSGSTGSPKLVRQSYRNLQSNAASIAQYLHLTAAQRPISSLPMHYTFGLSVINSHVLCGATEYLTESTVFDQSFWEYCKTGHITSIAGVPFTYECLKRLHFTKMDFPDLKLLIQAGGKLSRTLQKEYAEYALATGKKFIVMYGQTEATARMSYLPFADCLRKIGSIGIPIPGGTFHIMENAATEIKTPGITGELCYEGPNVTLGYAVSPDDLSRGDERHGRLMTGDMAYCDAEGFYYITGRKKRFIKIMGKRVNMDELEQLLKNAYDNYDFACTGADDNLWIFTTAPGESFAVMEDFLIQKTSLHPVCFHFHFIQTIPKNTSGKTQYPTLTALIK